MRQPDIVTVPQARFGELEPLWRMLYNHHSALTPRLRDREVPFEEAWKTRRELEQEWLRCEPDSFVIAARQGDRYVGYAFVRVRSGDDFAVSWRASRPLADLVTLVVAPDTRGHGVGSMLLDAVDARLRELGVEDMLITVITTNTDAMRLYERRGAVPFTTLLVHHVEPTAGAGGA